MDTKKYSQGDILTVTYVKKCQSENKNIGVIISDAEIVQTKYGDKLQVRININELILKWTMNTTSVANMQKYGRDSINWLSKKVKFTVIEKDGKEQLIGEAVE